MQASRALRSLVYATALFGLASCSDLPSRPVVGTPGPSPSEGAVSDSTLQANLAHWSALHVDTYRYRFRWECYCTPDYVRAVDITVMRGVIVSVIDVGTGKPVDGQAAAGYRTIEGLFDFVHSAIDYPAASVKGAFDPGLGYPSAVHVDYVANMADEEMGFRIDALAPLRRWGDSSASLGPHESTGR